jgi:2-amino-4-hydroxy-6-hydroxymethyldihydropteridine diphosphokinase
MSIAYLMLGSNLGDKKNNLQQAREAISKSAGRILVISSIYESEPWGFTHSEYFYNQLIILQTILKPEELLQIILGIEVKLGRIRNRLEYEARTIDIDILFYDNLILNSEALVIPHPRIASRRFVLVPILAIAPDLVHPGTGKTVWQMYRECEDELKVVILI